ncbi:MAG: AAA family ATPase [Fimbriimonadaceae bacterium]|nr:AAA family ATPase [Alphaproteobacteria bacterium]
MPIYHTGQTSFAVLRNSVFLSSIIPVQSEMRTTRIAGLMILGVLQQKGGVGKTTLSINLAACFAKKGLHTQCWMLTRQQSGVTGEHSRSSGSIVRKLPSMKTFGDLDLKFQHPVRYQT